MSPVHHKTHFIMTSVTIAVLMQPCKPLNPPDSKYNHAVPWEVIPTLAAGPLVGGKGAESLICKTKLYSDSPRTLLFKGSLTGQPGLCLKQESPSAGSRLVIGSPCTAPPGRCDSPCRGRGAGTWRWSRRSWTAADPAAGHIRHALLRRRGRGGSSRTPPPHTATPAWKQRRV